MTLLRRFCLLASLAFWQGGFTFYAAVVVPVGRRVLGSHLEQAMITRHVAWYLNLAGAAFLVFAAWEIFAEPGQTRPRLMRLICWLLLVATLGGLFAMHPWMDQYLDPDETRILDRGTFRFWHKSYLNISTVQWVVSLVFLGVTLALWRERRETAVNDPSARNGQLIIDN